MVAKFSRFFDNISPIEGKRVRKECPELSIQVLIITGHSMRQAKQGVQLLYHKRHLLSVPSVGFVIGLFENNPMTQG